MSQNKNEEINIKELLFYYLGFYKWFLVSILICLSVGVFYILKSNNVYEIKASILIKDKDSGMSEVAILDELGLSNGKSNIDNEIEQIKSADLIKRTIKTINYNINYRIKTRLKKELLHKDSPYIIDSTSIDYDRLQGVIQLIINKKKNGYIIELTVNDQTELISKSSFPTTIDTEIGRISIHENLSSPYLGETTYIGIINPEQLAISLSKNIKLNPTSKNSSVINITVQNENRKKGADFLEALIGLYNNQAIMDKNQIAYNTAVFIDNRLASLSDELSSVEKDVETYKADNKITDISSEAKMFLEQTSLFEEKRKEVETQLNIVEYVDNFLRDSKNNDELIPNLGITDPGLSTLVNQHNQLLIEKNRVQRSTTLSNPTLNNMINQLAGMRSSIRNSLTNVKKSLLINQKDITSEGKYNSAKIQQIPRIEREFIEIKRQQQIKETLYLFLLQKREETNLSLAATAPKAQVVSGARSENAPVSPRKNVILLIALTLGLIIPVVIIYIRDLFYTAIRNRDELEAACNVKVLGEIPINKTDNYLAVSPSDNSSMTELFRALRNDLNFILSDPNKKVITITSTTSNEGKTFISINLAATFAMIDKKVIIVGLDIRNPSLANYLGLQKSSGLTSYLSISKGNIDELIESSPTVKNLDIIQAGIIPPNPNELLSKQTLDDLFVELRSRYDHIIVDTAPAGIISDTFLVNRVSDLTLYVTRSKETDKESIEFLNSIYEQDRLHNLYVIFNASDIEKKRYGYKYGYQKPKKVNRFTSIKGIIKK